MNYHNLKNAFLKIKTRFLNLIFPIECLGCGRENFWLCPECLDRIKYQRVNRCVVCKELATLGQTHNNCREQTALDGVIVAAEWEDEVLQEAIHKYKYNFLTGMAEPLADILIKKIKSESGWEHLMADKKITLVPIPLHPRRLRWRGFNQAELLAEKISQQLGWEKEKFLLQRRRYTEPQAKLKKETRQENLAGAFAITQKKEAINRERLIILVDDVLTTGATMNECARVLKQNGIKTVWGLALARG